MPHCGANWVGRIIGIVLCTDKNETMAKYSVLSENENLFASKYMLYLPTEEELKHELERERELLERQIDEGDSKWAKR